MDLDQYFKSVIDQDSCDIVICNLDHTILYMNPAAKSHSGGDLTGRNLHACHNPRSVELINNVVEWFKADQTHNSVFLVHREAINRDQYMIALRDEDGKLIGYYEKHEYRNPETRKPYDLY